MNTSSLETEGQRVEVPYWQRRQVSRRLEELSISTQCLPDGQLHVEINHGTAAVQLWSVVQQFRATRSQMVDWLEQCWRLPAL